MAMKYFVLLSGKRKSGKDFVAEKLQRDLQAQGLTVAIIRLSEPLKREFARMNNLDLQNLLSSSSYKEKFRSEMVQWGEDIRRKDEGYFCRSALELCPDAKSAQIFIVSDCRRPSDFKYFCNLQSIETCVMKVRIISDETSRKNRGWIFVPGIDDADTECALDSVMDWDMILTNNDSSVEDFETSFNKLKSDLLCIAVK